MAQITVQQAKDRVWQAILDTNLDGQDRGVELVRGTNVVTVHVARRSTTSGIDEVV
jgi:hypothetical protein